jgi:hypothetical protein
MRIFKYPLEITDRQIIHMPYGAKSLCVKAQHGKPMLWALVDEFKDKEARSFAVYGTGNPIPELENQPTLTLTYIDTVLTHQDSLVWHVFEVTA